MRIFIFWHFIEGKTVLIYYFFTVYQYAFQTLFPMPLI